MYTKKTFKKAALLFACGGLLFQSPLSVSAYTDLNSPFFFSENAKISEKDSNLNGIIKLKMESYTKDFTILEPNHGSVTGFLWAKRLHYPVRKIEKCNV